LVARITTMSCRGGMIRRFCTRPKPPAVPSFSQRSQSSRGGSSRGRGGSRGGDDSGSHYSKQGNRFKKIDPELGRVPLIDPVSGIEEGGRLQLLVGPQPNSNLIPLKMREEIYQLHLHDPDKLGCLQRMATKLSLPVQKIQAIVKLVAFEKKYEAESGVKLDQTADIEAREEFGERKDFKDRSYIDFDQHARDLLSQSRFHMSIPINEVWDPEEAAAKERKIKPFAEMTWKLPNVDKLRGQVVKEENGYLCRKVDSKSTRRKRLRKKF